MKKVLIILSFFILSGCAYPIWGQQNGTFNNCYVNFLKPVYPTGAGLNIKNTLAPLNMYINDTSFVNYIIYWSKKGTHYLSFSDTTSTIATQYYVGSQGFLNFSDTTSILATKADLGTLTLDSSKLITVYDVGNNFSGHVQNYFLNSPNFHSSLSIKNTGAIFNASGLLHSYSHLQLDSIGGIFFEVVDQTGHHYQDLYFYPSGMFYDYHLTNNSPRWVPDKFYTDSLVAAIPAPTLDSSKLITKYDLTQPALYTQNYYLRPNLNNTLSLTPDYFDAYILGNNLTLTELRADTAANFRVDCQNLNTGNHQFYLFDTTGLFYDTHKTDINPLWVPDRYYIDSLVAAIPASTLDSSKLITKYDLSQPALYTQNYYLRPNLNNTLSLTADYFDAYIKGNNLTSTELTADTTASFFVDCQNDNTGNYQFYLFDTTGLYYGTHKTDINPLWVPDRYYIDSLINTRLPSIFSISHGAAQWTSNLDTASLDIYNSDLITQNEIQMLTGSHGFNLNSFDLSGTGDQSQIGINPKQISLAVTWSGPSTGITIDSSGCTYFNRQTSQNPEWIPDKYYIDSVSTTLALDSSKLVTNYNAQSGLGFNVLYASHQT